MSSEVLVKISAARSLRAVSGELAKGRGNKIITVLSEILGERVAGIKLESIPDEVEEYLYPRDCVKIILTLNPGPHKKAKSKKEELTQRLRDISPKLKKHNFQLILKKSEVETFLIPTDNES